MNVAWQTMILNKHLSELMDGLTAKVFRTFNASKTLQEQLEELTSGRCCVACRWWAGLISEGVVLSALYVRDATMLRGIQWISLTYCRNVLNTYT